MTNDFGDDSGEKLVDWMIRIGQDAGEAAMMASGERLASAFRRARGEDAIEGGAEPGRSVAEWAKLDLSEFTALPEYETIRQAIDEKLSREGIRHEFAPMPEGEHLVFMVEDAPLSFPPNPLWQSCEENCHLLYKQELYASGLLFHHRHYDKRLPA